MIVPQYWAESRRQHRGGGRQVTVRRFGWSDLSAVDAQATADVRADDALRRILSGETLSRRDFRAPYNGSEGVPIREEIVARFGETIVTRNSYGARCLNTPNVLFVDIDFHHEPPLRFRFGVFALLLVASATAAWLLHSRALGGLFAFLSLLSVGGASSGLYRLLRATQGGPARAARKRIDRFLADRPEWGFRLYRTPAGLRLLAIHKTFEPSDPAVIECFNALGADPVYVRMCLNQQCFRARVSAKPWRAGIKEHMRPRPGLWPIAPERMPDRIAWVHRYEAVASSFAACSYIETVGSRSINPDVQPVQTLHDELSAATSALPMA